ncbi:MAG: VWA domain-containing protein [Pseudomonadota bacterium]
MNFLPADLVENFHFLRPLFLLAIIPALLLVLLLRFLQSSQSSWQLAIDARLLPYLLDKNSTPAQSYPLYGLFLVWVLGIVAMAGPVWQQNPVPVQEKQDALVIVLDLSMSMFADDVSPNRATRAQRKIIDILEYRRAEGQTGLVVYAGDAHAVTPMTDDVETISNLVPSLRPDIMPVLGSKPLTGISLAMDLLANSALARAHILLLSDGVENTDVQAINEQLAGSGHRLSVLGFGTEQGAPIPMGQQGFLRDQNNAIVIPRLERAPLQLLASDNNGRYSDAQLTDDDIKYLLDSNIFTETENLVDVEREYDTWNESGPWLLLLALPFAAMAFRRGWLLSIALLFFITPSAKTYALDWQDLWQRKDQQGQDAFTQEQYDRAAEEFRDPAWRGAANYRNENYEQVVQDLALLDNPEAHYNRGNALAKLQQFEAAIAAYDQALVQNPDLVDAQHNKEIVEELLKQQEEQNQQQQNSEGEQQDQQEGEQQDQQSQDQQQQQQSQQQQQQNQDQQQQEGEQDQQAQQEQESQDQAQKGDQESEEGEQQEQEMNPSDSQASKEEEQAMQQWLQRIPDDPGELLRNKFRYQSQQRAFDLIQNPAMAEQQAAEKIW